MLINIQMLKAIRFGASAEETRYYLQGVFIKTQGNHIVMCATDGHRMIIGRHAGGADGEHNAGMIIPIRMIDRIKIAKKLKDHDGVLTVDGQIVTIKYAGEIFVDQLIDGTFPDYTRVIPKGWSNEPAQYNPALLVDFVKAVKIVSNNTKPSITVHQNGLNAAVVNLNSGNELDWFGVIMPMRGDKPFPNTEWALPPKAEEKAA